VNRVRWAWLVAALVVAVVAVVALVGSVAAVAAGVSRSRTGIGSVGFGVGSGGDDGGGYGPGMMGGSGAGGGMAGSGTRGGVGHGMMGGYGSGGAWMTGGRYGLSGDGHAVTTMAAARARAQAFADRLGGGLKAGEVMQFSNGYYSELLTSDGQGATEVLIDPATGAVSIEYGPAMMWNTRYGMRATGATVTRVGAAEAVKKAQAWLVVQHLGLTAGEPTAFPGYYTLHTLKDGAIVGMMSVNAITGAAWYHTWHGEYVAMVGE
jgi:hypothetical protein